MNKGGVLVYDLDEDWEAEELSHCFCEFCTCVCTGCCLIPGTAVPSVEDRKH